MASYKAFLFAFLLISFVIVSVSADYPPDADYRYNRGPQTVVTKVVRRPYDRRKDGTIFDAAADIANGIFG